MQAEPRSPIFTRNPFEIIGECFTVYGRHFRQIIVIALIVQIPLSVFELAIADSLTNLFLTWQAAFQPAGEEQTAADAPSLPPIDAGIIAPLAGYAVIALMLSILVNAAIAYAVGMQYATGGVDVARCWSRAWWRILSLLVLGVVSLALIALMFVGFALGVVLQALIALMFIGLVLLILPGLAVIALMVYWSVATPAVVIEGCRPLEALKRSFGLVRRNWLRTFAVWLLIILVTIGITTALTIATGLPSGFLEDTGALATAYALVTGTIVGALTTPVGGIAGTLLYLDLRQRADEDYDVETLSSELGINPPPDGAGRFYRSA